MNQLRATRPELSRIQFSSGVIFPFAPFRVRSVEWSQWEVIDSRIFRSQPLSRSLLRMMDAARAHLLGASASPGLESNAPTDEQSATIRDALRARFEIPVDRRARAEHLETELQRYTSEQFSALDAMESNPRTIYVGPAGVGKTIIAVEAARRARVEGRRVLFVCFNHMLGAWLERQTAEMRPEVVALTLHRHMLDVSELGRTPQDAGPEYWQSILPDTACERLLEDCGDDRDSQIFDVLIVDEAQDILREPYLDFLDLSLRGGLSSGHWRFFGDFENQAIYDAANISLEEFRVRRAAGVPIYSLRVNCRNTPLVAEWVRVLAKLDPGYNRVLRQDDGISPTFLFYEDEAGRLDRLVEALTILDAQGFRGQDIVVLSPRADGTSAASGVHSQPWRDRLCPLSRVTGGKVGYATIQTFKGMEAAAVVVSDIETINTARDQALLYVATTRPLQRLIIVAHDRVREEAIRIVSAPTPLRRKVR